MFLCPLQMIHAVVKKKKKSSYFATMKSRTQSLIVGWLMRELNTLICNKIGKKKLFFPRSAGKQSSLVTFV